MWLYVEALYPVLTIVLGAVVFFMVVSFFANKQKQAHINSGAGQCKKRPGTFD